MSVKDELLLLSQEMQERARHTNDVASLVNLIAVAAAEIRGIAKGMADGDGQATDEQRLLLTARAKVAEQDARRRAAVQEADAMRVVEVVGGPGGDTSVPVPGDTVEGAYTSIAGGLYRYLGGKLIYSPKGGGG